MGNDDERGGGIEGSNRRRAYKMRKGMREMELTVKVRKKVAQGCGRRIVCANSDYTVRFDLDEEWSGYAAKTMRVDYGNGTYTDVVFTGETAALPVIRGRRMIRIGLYAGNIHTTTPAAYECEESISDAGGIPAAPEADVYAQLTELLESGKIKGEKGDTGARGPQGEKGDTGATGPQGTTGPRGPQGAAGAAFTYDMFTAAQLAALKGEKGDKGATGPKGDPGEQGPQGEKGDPGATGPQGATGPRGPQGATGAAFTYDMFTAAQLAALKGEKGDTGATGPQGEKGATGATGPQGPRGEKGATGPQGPQGEKGATGPRGPQGSKGDPGTVTVTTLTVTDSSSSLKNVTGAAKYFPALGMGILRVYGQTNAELTAGTTYDVAKISGNFPRAVNALSVCCGKQVAARINSSGMVQIRPQVAVAAGYDVYIAGVWTSN